MKPGADKLYLTANTYTYTGDATHADDGIIIGVPVPITEPDTNGALKVYSSDKPYTIGASSDPNHLTLSTKDTPAQYNMAAIRSYGDSFLKVRTNFTLNSGTISSAVCSLKQPTAGLWKVRWTGVPVIDQFVCASGKKFYSLAVDMIVNCPEKTPINFYFDWEINFTTPFTYVWNFVVQTLIEMVSAPFLNMSMVPYVTTYEDMRHLTRNKREVVPQPMLDVLPEEDTQDPPEFLSLYPQLPTAPILPNVDDTKQKPSLLKRLFKKKGKD